MAVAAAQIGVPTDPLKDNQAKLTVTATGDRKTDGTVGPAAGAVFEFFTVPDGSVKGGKSLDTCQTDAQGRCGIITDLDRTSGNGNNKKTHGFYYAVQKDGPVWIAADNWGSSESSFIRSNTGQILGSGSARSRTVELSVGDKPWPFVRANPAAPQKCGIDMAVVYDLSGSVTAPATDTSPTMLSKYKDAGKKFVDALAGTPSTISLHTFASNAPARNTAGYASNNANLPPVSVAQPSGVTTLKTKISGYDVSSESTARGTNWDEGLSSVGADYDVVLFLTDGDPTWSGSGANATNSGSGTTTTLPKVREAIHSANKIKAAGTKVIAVGIGDGVTSDASKQRLKLISGTENGTDFFTTGFDQLGTKLTELATKDCNGTVTVVKSVQDEAGNTAPGAGWEFRADGSNVLVSGTSSSSGKTDANGALNFKVSGYSSTVTKKSVSIAEVQQDGFELVKQGGVNAVCTNLATQKTVAVSSSGALGFTVDVPQADPITCSVINKKLTSKISIVKTANGGQPVTGPDNAPDVPSGTSVTWTYTVTNTGTTTLNNIVVRDDRITGMATCKKSTLAPAESTTCTATGIVKAQ